MGKFKIQSLTLAGILFAFASIANAGNITATGIVTGVQPQYRNVSVPVTIDDCRNVEVPVYGQTQPSTGDAVAGAIIGGLLGNQFGEGKGKDAMTVLGAIAGADAATRNNQNRIVGYRTERQCTSRVVQETRNELSSYRITYEIFGIAQTATVNKPYRVGDYISVRVEFSPN